jgi:BASS family bile acid:Na+ symporter
MEAGILINVLTPAVLAMIMLGMGMSLSLSDFSRVARYPKATFVGLTGQLLLLPILGFLLVVAFEPAPEMAVGLLVLAFCPGGATSNILSYLARADTALSVTLTAISSFITPLTVPFLVNAALSHFMGQESAVQLPIGSTLFQILMITVVPISLGIVINHYAPHWCRRAEGPVKVLGMGFLVMLTAGISWNERNNLPTLLADAGLLTASLCASSYVLAFIASTLTKLPYRQKASVCIEVGMQNANLAMVITTSILQNTQMAVAPAVYALMMFGFGWPMVFWFNRHITAQEAGAAAAPLD